MKNQGQEVVIDPDSMEEWERQKYLSTGAVSGPDWHTSSWLNLTELLEALEQIGFTIENQSPQVRAVLSTMQILSDAYGIEKVRIVFWFDG